MKVGGGLAQAVKHCGKPHLWWLGEDIVSEEQYWSLRSVGGPTSGAVCLLFNAVESKNFEALVTFTLHPWLHYLWVMGT